MAICKILIILWYAFNLIIVFFYSIIKVKKKWDVLKLSKILTEEEKLYLKYFKIIFTVILFFSYTSSLSAKTKITWWNYSDEGGGLDSNLRELVQDKFNASQNEIELEIVFKDGNINDNTRTALLAGVGPDIITSSGSSYVKAYHDAGLLLSLERYSKEYGWKDIILPWAYNTGVFDGEFYSFPSNYETMLYFYNKTLFEENGWKLPTNLKEYEALVQEIRSKGMNAFVYGSSGWQPTHEHLVGNYFNTYAGPENVYKALTGEKKWTDPIFVESIELLKKHMLDGYWSGSLENYYAIGWDDYFSQLTTRKAAMLPIGTWGFGDTIAGFSEISDEFGWSKLPILGNYGGNPNYQLSIGSTMSINAASKFPDEAAKVINWMISDKKRVVELTKNLGFGNWLIPLKYDDKDFSEDIHPSMRDFFIDFSETTGKGDYGYTTWTFYPAEAGSHVWKEMEVVWAGDISVMEYLEEQQKLWDKARSKNALIPVGKR